MTYQELLDFIKRDMRMSHVYQPTMIRELLKAGRASAQEIARALLNEDRSQLEYYAEITRDMVGKVLRKRGVVERVGSEYALPGFSTLTPEEIDSLRKACDKKLQDYVERRGAAIWEHRRKSRGYVSGTLRYEVLKAAKSRCELCGVSVEERAIEVDHIVPRNKGGTDEIANLQALCYSCNAMKRDRDDTDFRQVLASYGHRVAGCPFCAMAGRAVILENTLAIAIEDAFPVTPLHLLIIPKRHVATYYELGVPEVRACHDLLSKAEVLIRERDPSVKGVNIGINSGQTAGQTVPHCHIHLIPRRVGDHPNPRGGVRAVIPGKADYPVSTNAGADKG